MGCPVLCPRTLSSSEFGTRLARSEILWRDQAKMLRVTSFSIRISTSPTSSPSMRLRLTSIAGGSSPHSGRGPSIMTPSNRLVSNFGASRAALVRRRPCNVGGGYPSDILAQAPLKWIMDKASAHGLRSDHISMWTRQTECARHRFLRKLRVALLRMFSKRYYRPVGAEPAVAPGAQRPGSTRPSTHRCSKSGAVIRPIDAQPAGVGRSPQGGPGEHDRNSAGLQSTRSSSD